MEIILATRNKNKVKEIKKLFGGLNINFLCLEDFNNKISIDEDCKTIRGNAIKKAYEVAKILDKLVLADDSGIDVNCLRGAPGVLSARFAGEKCTYKDNNKKLLKLLKGVPLEKRNAKFRCVFALADKNGLIKAVEGICKGKITCREIGENGFGYDPVFKPEKETRTFAEMSLEEKNKISHRSKAAYKMICFLYKKRLRDE